MPNKTIKRAQGRPRDFDEAYVLKQAQQVFLDASFEGVAYEKVAEAAGLSKPSLYNAFGDKTALFERAIADYAERAHAQIMAHFRDGKSLQDAARKVLVTAADIYSKPSGPSSGCLLVGTALPACAQLLAARVILAKFIASLEASLEAAMSEHFAADARCAGKSPQALALLLSSLLFSLAVRARTGVTRTKLRGIARELSDLFC